MSDEKFILDATAGFRMMWFNKHHPNTLYIDSRPECEPDQVADFTHLKYPDETFQLIVFDPPHIIKEKGNTNMGLEHNFGMLKAETWQQELKDGFKELWRVLKPMGILIFKWNTYSLSSDEMLKIAPADPLFYQVSASRNKIARKKDNPHVKTLWFCFMKIPQQEKQR